MNPEPAVNYHLGPGGVPPYQPLPHYQGGIPGADPTVMQPVVDVGAYGMPPHPNDAYHQQPQAQYDAHHMGHPQQPHFDQHQADFMQHSLHPSVLDHNSQQQAHHQPPQQSLGMPAPSDSHPPNSSVGNAGTNSQCAPTYDELFPALPESEQTVGGQGGAWSSGGPGPQISHAAMHSVPAVAVNSMPSIS